MAWYEFVLQETFTCKLLHRWFWWFKTFSDIFKESLWSQCVGSHKWTLKNAKNGKWPFGLLPAAVYDPAHQASCRKVSGLQARSWICKTPKQKQTQEFLWMPLKLAWLSLWFSLRVAAVGLSTKNYGDLFLLPNCCLSREHKDKKKIQRRVSYIEKTNTCAHRDTGTRPVIAKTIHKGDAPFVLRQDLRTVEAPAALLDYTLTALFFPPLFQARIEELEEELEAERTMRAKVCLRCCKTSAHLRAAGGRAVRWNRWMDGGRRMEGRKEGCREVCRCGCSHPWGCCVLMLPLPLVTPNHLHLW